MTTAYIYTAIRVLSEAPELNNGHITTSFTKVDRKLPEIYLPAVTPAAIQVARIEHWEQAGVVVAVLADSNVLLAEHRRLLASGLEYNYAYCPYVTIAYTRETDLAKYAHLLGKTVVLHNSYVGTLIKD